MKRHPKLRSRKGVRPFLCNRAIYVNQRSYVLLLRNGSLASSQLTNIFMNECNSPGSRLIDRSLVKSDVSRFKTNSSLFFITLRCLKRNESEIYNVGIIWLIYSTKHNMLSCFLLLKSDHITITMIIRLYNKNVLM